MLWATSLLQNVYVYLHFYAMLPETAEFGEITQNMGHFAIRGHKL